MLFIGFEYECVTCGKQVMVEEDQCLFFLHHGKVILQPVVYIFLSIISRVVSVVDWGDYIMNVTHIK
jgi:hypothetical protein